MAVRDIEAFLRQQAVLFDPNLDVTPGSPFDTRIIQPTVRRLGTDPFTVDMTTFINDRLAQAFPDLAVKEGDALTDLLNKPASLLWDPIVREVRRVQRNLSFADPSSLTKDEADALGANFFRDRRTGQLARGIARLYVANPQNVSISPNNFVTSKGGLHFFPSEIQSIRTEEVILNVGDDGLYYFDFNVTAEQPGVVYDIGPNELISIANVPAVVRVTNPRRFSRGEDEESVEDYVDRLRREIGEKSLVTLRGIAAKILDSFPDVNRLNVVGFGDPEMQRDVLRGGGLGSVVGGGVAGVTVADAEGQVLTRRFSQSEESFIDLVSGDATDWVLTVFEAFGGSVLFRDLPVLRVVSATDIDVQDQVMVLGETDLRWTLRKRSLTLSSIPGGILFPDSSSGTVDVDDDSVHIGGAYDVHIRGTDFDEATLTVENVTDDAPLLSGSELLITGASVSLQDFVEGTDYDEDDATWQIFEDSAIFGYALEILEGVDAGVYRITRVTQVASASPTLALDPTPTNPGATLYRWRLFDEIDIDLVEPKETRYEGEDLRTVQGSDLVDTLSTVDFSQYGVAEGDTLRILSGPDAGDYALVADPVAPSFASLQIDTELTQSQSNLEFVIFRPNAAGGMEMPLVRVTSVEILDSSSQPIGSTVPYARPIDIQSRTFQNPARGVKWDLSDADLGLLSQETTGGNFAVSGGETLIFVLNQTTYTFTFVGGPITLADTISQLNAWFAGLADAHPLAVIQIGSTRFGIRPRRGGVFLVGGTAQVAVFGDTELRTTFDIRSATITAAGGWDSLNPAADITSRLDVLQVTDGNNIGFYEAPYLTNYQVTSTGTSTPTTGLLVGHEQPLNPVLDIDFEGSGFSPEENRRVQVGTRSIGSARMYFLEPTSIEVDPDTRFILTQDDGSVLRFLPDPTLNYQRVPALPAASPPADGVSTSGADIFTSAGSDFVRSGIKPGDRLVIGTFPIEGTVILANPVPGLVNETLILSIDDGPDRTLTFIRDDISLAADEVSRSGVLDQINAAAGEDIVALTGTDTLQISTTRKVIIRGGGTANATILGDVANTSPTESFVGSDQDNLSPHAGTYDIYEVGNPSVDRLDVLPLFPGSSPYTSSPTDQNFTVLQQGLQRITATSMAENEAEASLYYFDVELISEGTGDAWNIDAEQQMTAEGYRSDGYYLTTSDSNLTFSSEERPTLVLSRSILENGVDDDPVNATQLTGQNLQITYDRSSIVASAQDFLSSDEERVVCSSPLSRHLVPHFVRFDLNYIGGSKESVVVPEIERYITGLYPTDELESSDLQKIILDRGATSIENPIDLIAVVHGTDRSVYVSRSQDSLTATRLAAFIPDVLNITRNTA